ncbi:hypothetical protein Poly51_00230 [Rubripirellula tenax]|uniref:Uncharacterized protein n=1 Tax=Rubripirellula tenax TaxID=2528015 RepID=A0A5C6FE43_9BACT|nr:hypothetical protein [Rubripirellula tenax]TWU59751.1 hypothetical protein Poly51_00230 [Rubripirellula tenax]
MEWNEMIENGWDVDAFAHEFAGKPAMLRSLIAVPSYLERTPAKER